MSESMALGTSKSPFLWTFGGALERDGKRGASVKVAVQHLAEGTLEKALSTSSSITA